MIHKCNYKYPALPILIIYIYIYIYIAVISKQLLHRNLGYQDETRNYV